MSTPTVPPALAPWVTARDFSWMQGALGHIIASWARPLRLLVAIDAQTPGAIPAADFDALRRQVTTIHGPTYGRGYAAPDQYGVLRQGYFAPVDFVGGIWDAATIEVVRPEGIVLYSGAVLVYQRHLPLGKYDVIVDPADPAQDPAGTRFLVADDLADVEAFGTSIYRYAALEQRGAGDIVYEIPLY